METRRYFPFRHLQLLFSIILPLPICHLFVVSLIRSNGVLVTDGLLAQLGQGDTGEGDGGQVGGVRGPGGQLEVVPGVVRGVRVHGGHHPGAGGEQVHDGAVAGGVGVYMVLPVHILGSCMLDSKRVVISTWGKDNHLSLSKDGLSLVNSLDPFGGRPHLVLHLLVVSQTVSHHLQLLLLLPIHLLGLEGTLLTSHTALTPPGDNSTKLLCL